MKFKHLVIILFLLPSLAIQAQRRSEMLEKQLETIKVNPNNHDALLFLCEHYLQQGNYSKTVTYAEYLKNMTENQQNPSIQLCAHLYLGKAQMMSGREKAARKNLDKALEHWENIRQTLTQIITKPSAIYIKELNWLSKNGTNVNMVSC